MVDYDDRHKSILECYARAVVHMRKQIELNRFGLVFGAGISDYFGIPNWSKLVDLIAKDDRVKGEHILKMVPPRASLPYKTEMLFEHFKNSEYNIADEKAKNTRELDFKIGADWREIIRTYLYKDVKEDLAEKIKTHPYINEFIPLVKKSHMTVTYNFDDFIEQTILCSKKGSDESTRGYECVTNPWTQFKKTEAIIYHANGVVPQNRLETPSDRFVFSEASFAEQLIGIFSGDHAGLINHFSKHTCLFIGLSLEDETLKNVLLQSARSCPGNYHYYVHYLSNGPLPDEERHAITYANFKVYNLITLFLDGRGIKSLGELLNNTKLDGNRFCDFAEQNDIRVKFKYYITGPLGVGKSTTINQFRNLYVLDEWMDLRPDILTKDWETLSGSEKLEVDDWIVGQFRKKNDALRDQKEGIYILDRGPLDPLAFSHESERKAKAKKIRKALCPGRATWKVEDGKVILFKGDEKELSIRMILTNRKDYTADKLKIMEEKISSIYGKEGIIEVDTKGLTPADVAHRVAEIIHLNDYEPTNNLHNRLEEIEQDGYNETES